MHACTGLMENLGLYSWESDWPYVHCFFKGWCTMQALLSIYRSSRACSGRAKAASIPFTQGNVASFNDMPICACVLKLHMDYFHFWLSNSLLTTEYWFLNLDSSSLLTQLLFSDSRVLIQLHSDSRIKFLSDSNITQHYMKQTIFSDTLVFEQF